MQKYQSSSWFWAYGAALVNSFRSLGWTAVKRLSMGTCSFILYTACNMVCEWERVRRLTRSSPPFTDCFTDSVKNVRTGGGLRRGQVPVRSFIIAVLPNDPQAINYYSSLSLETWMGQGIPAKKTFTESSCLHGMGHPSLRVCEVTKAIETFKCFCLKLNFSFKALCINHILTPKNN